MNRPAMAAARKDLVIDDDAAACSLIEEALTRYGIEVQSSHDQRTGLEAAKAIIPARPESFFVFDMLRHPIPDTQTSGTSKRG
jgi:ActR/RegA family two-component response regulator